MDASVKVPPSERHWTYASLTVLDGYRRLKPTHAAFDRLIFAHPPRLQSSQIEIILRSGDAQQHHRAQVLPHDQAAIQIPIRLIGPVSL